MSSTNSLSSRLEELRSRNPQSPPGESIYSGYSTPNRFSGSFLHSHSQSLAASNDSRASSLQRRFTADSNTFPAPLSAMANPQMQNIDTVDMAATTMHKVSALDKKRVELEKYREHKKRMEDELKRFASVHEQQEEEYARMANDFQGLSFSPGHQSEPATPPEYREPGNSSIYPNRNRYSSASLTSPPGMSQRLSRSGSQVTSPPSESAQSRDYENEADKLPSKSVPASRRGSSDRFSQYLPETGGFNQRTAASNRYSMPVNFSMRQKRESAPDFASSVGLSHIDTTSILFGDDDEAHKDAATSPDVKSYLQANTTEDKFPILVRSNHKPGTLSASSAALDLAFLQSSDTQEKNESGANGWPSFSRHRHSQHSMPQNILDAQSFVEGPLASPSASSQQSVDTVVDSPIAARQANRHSMEATMAVLAQKNAFGSGLGNASASRPNIGSLQSSYSTNDIPTLKGSSATTSASITSPTANNQSAFHKHNASLGRIPPSAANRRMSRDVPSAETRPDEASNGVKQLQSDLQSSAAPFSPSYTAGSPTESGVVTSPGLQQFTSPAAYYGYGLSLMNMGVSPMQLANTSYGNGMQYYQPQNQYASFSPYNTAGRGQDSQARVIQQRRMQNVEDVARFSNAKIEQYRGEIYSLCKDQHGCRYLQKQLETRIPETVQMIFVETSQHVTELMTDPFGNYLCQKLLEHTNDAQRTVLVDTAAPQMVQIALNPHGTRALQKMIEHLSTPEQIQTVIHALEGKVVELIQDLNGNHVIQKCLNRLMPEDAQFIFNAVGKSCVIVGTHRHGCCVLQRCIDHASGQQRADLIAQITQNALRLVQDPYGNYVLQYIIDLNDPVFTNPLCYSLQSRVVDLSKHKFSSNVVEKCIRHAEPPINTMMVDEMLGANEIEKMLRDSYANYVVQTALDHADPDTRTRLVDAIRPVLPSIRHTPHGRRIQSKIVASENSSLMSSPVDSPMTQHAVAVGGMNGAHGPFGGRHRPNGFYGGHNQNAYGQNFMHGQQAFAQGHMPAMNGGPRLNNGMGGYPFGAGNTQNPGQPFNRAPQAASYNFF